MVLSLVILLVWGSMILLSIALIHNKHRHSHKDRRRLFVALLCGIIVLGWFYFPRSNVFPSSEYAPITVAPADGTPHDTALLTDDTASQILHQCNQLYASRSAWKTLFNRDVGGGAALYIYFSGKGENRTQNYILCSTHEKNNQLVKAGLAYHIWNPTNLYHQLKERL